MVYSIHLTTFRDRELTTMGHSSPQPVKHSKMPRPPLSVFMTSLPISIPNTLLVMLLLLF